MWEDVWSDATPGTESALRMHLGPVCSLLKETLQSQSWIIKEQVSISYACVLACVEGYCREYSSLLCYIILVVFHLIHG